MVWNAWLLYGFWNGSSNGDGKDGQCRDSSVRRMGMIWQESRTGLKVVGKAMMGLCILG